MSLRLKCTSRDLQDSNDNTNPLNASNYAKNESTSGFDVELCEINNSSDFDQALTNAVVHYVASLCDSFSLSEDEIQKVMIVIKLF